MAFAKWSWYAGASLLAHAGLVAALRATPRHEAHPVETKTEFFPVELPPPPPPPPPKERPPEPEAKAPAEAPKQPPKEASKAPPAAVAEAPRAAPVRLAGLGLSNAGFVFAASDSTAVTHSQPVTQPAVATAAPAPPRAPEGPPLLKVSDLSERPTPPALDGSLRKNYPPELERQGIEGDALLRLTLSVTGKVIEAKTLSQSHAAFAEACRKTLLGTAWSPPRDRSGKPVRTSLDYRCRFKVSR